MKQQEQMKEKQSKLADDAFEQRQRASKYEFESRLQDELIANMEFKANTKLLEMMQQRQQEEAERKMKQDL